jgi:hypothetical protein
MPNQQLKRALTMSKKQRRMVSYRRQSSLSTIDVGKLAAGTIVLMLHNIKTFPTLNHDIKPSAARARFLF